MPDGQLNGVRPTPVKYADAMSMSRSLLAELGVVTVVDGRYKVTQERLIDGDAALFWSEHGDRAQLATWGAALGFEQAALDAVGRWSAKGAAEYIRVNRHLCLKLQDGVARGVRGAADPGGALGERDVSDLLSDFLVAASWGQDRVKAQLDRLAFAPCAAPADPPAAAAGPAPAAEEVADSSSEETSAAASPPSRAAAVPQPPDEEPLFFISITMRAKKRCLHRAGGCDKRPGVNYSVYESFHQAPEPEMYTDVCRRCWPGGSVPRAVPADPVAADEASGSSTSSSSSDEASGGEARAAAL